MSAMQLPGDQQITKDFGLKLCHVIAHAHFCRRWKMLIQELPFHRLTWSGWKLPTALTTPQVINQNMGTCVALLRFVSCHQCLNASQKLTFLSSFSCVSAMIISFIIERALSSSSSKKIVLGCTDRIVDLTSFALVLET